MLELVMPEKNHDGLQFLQTLASDLPSLGKETPLDWRFVQEGVPHYLRFVAKDCFEDSFKSTLPVVIVASAPDGSRAAFCKE